MIRASTIRLVATREITERLRGRATWIQVGITTLLVVGLIVVPPLLSQPTPPTVIGLVGSEAQSLGPPLEAAAQAAGLNVTTVAIESDAVARSELTSSQASRTESRRQGGGAALDAALRVDAGAPTIEVAQEVPPAVAAVVRETANQAHQQSVLSQAGVSSAVIAQSRQPVPINVVVLQPQPADFSGRALAAVAVGILLFVNTGLFGAAVANGVAQEKTSRTAEVLLSAVDPAELMAGKVLGIGLVAVGQMAVTVVAGLAANALVQSSEVPPVVWTLLPMVLLWFTLGYALYSLGFAAAGAMVARQEDVQSVGVPFSVFIAGGYFLVFPAMAAPDALWVQILSFFPPLTPMLMPERLALGHLAPWEMPAAVVLMLASIYGMAWLAGGIYRAALIRSGPRLSWAAAIRLRGASGKRG